MHYPPDILKRLQRTELSILRDAAAVCESNGIDYFLIGGSGIGALRTGGFVPWDDDIDIGMRGCDIERFLDAIAATYGDRYEVFDAQRRPGFAAMSVHLCLRGTLFQAAESRPGEPGGGIFLDIFAFEPTYGKALPRGAHVLWCWLLGKLYLLSVTPAPHVGAQGFTRRLCVLGCTCVHGLLRVLRLSPDKLIRGAMSASRAYRSRDMEAIGYFFDTRPFASVVPKSAVFPTREGTFEGMRVRLPADMDKVLRTCYGEYMTLPPVEKRVNHCPRVLDFGEGNVFGGKT